MSRMFITTKVPLNNVRSAFQKDREIDIYLHVLKKIISEIF